MSVRDLEAEGVLSAVVPSKSVGMAEWTSATVLIDLQSRTKRLEADMARLTEVVSSLIAKQGQSK
jgi:hypothetical protein